ncbi:MAG: hypothetical protein J0M12_12655 [Deltaproteobacteria bacterium]|nr:hypothetical protein [Deltaproteobacteria bacterium]
MRVALCLSGMPRSFKKCADGLFRNFIDIYKPDIFISTWLSEMVDDAFPETDSPHELIDLYKPLKFDIEIYNEKRKASFETNPFKNFSDRGGRSVSRMIPMFYKIHLADMHRFYYEQENKFAYDVVVRCRTDILLHKPVQLEAPAPNTLYFPVKNSTSNVNDQFWYSDSATASQICGLYYAIPELWYRGILIHGEALLYSYALAKQFLVKPIDVDYDLQR